eukprot:TRINITY_DN57834_c0_g1_i1.p1 TRINITY_DN57834_c0_g1~~TRINITY_DN57834_c0_g1_i1.p1  ORF type:complete len:436 (+),score=203.43 TRINITY_DN57834_c0_g1_i1:70-1377(+)
MGLLSMCFSVAAEGEGQGQVQKRSTWRQLRRWAKGQEEATYCPKGRDADPAVRNEPAVMQVETIEEFRALVRLWAASNYFGFREKFTAAVEGVSGAAYPAGTDGSVEEDWEGADVETLLDFFGRWYAFYPMAHGNGLQYIQKFSWLYYNNKAGLHFVTTYPGAEMCKQFTVLNGKKMDSSASKAVVDDWISALGKAKMSQYIVPAGGFQNYNEFFRREIKPELRPVSHLDKQEWIASPADSVLTMVDDSLELTSKPLDVKGQRLNVMQLLDNSTYAKLFEGGTALSCILTPDDYHRFHAPCNGTVVESSQDVMEHYFGIPKLADFVNNGNTGYGSNYAMFESFRRGYLIIDTDTYGHIAMVPVGLNTVGSVVFHDQFKSESLPQPLHKGEEVGYFQYGGSLVILLFQKGVFPAVRVHQGNPIGFMEPLTEVTAGA